LGAKPIERLDAEIQTVQAANYGGVSFFCWETTLWGFKESDTQAVLKTLSERFSIQESSDQEIG